MLEEILVIVDDRPGILAEIGELLGESGVNIETISATAYNDRGVIHLVVDDGEDAGELLVRNGFKVEGVHPVYAATLDDRPGELGRYCRRLADNGVQVSAVYVARRGGGETELIFAVDDIDAARAV